MGLANLRGRDGFSLEDGIDGFRQAMAAMNLFPPNIVADGKYHRFTYGTKGKNDKGWYRLFAEPVVAGSFGLWGAEGFTQKWSQVNKRELTLEERREFAVSLRKAREESEKAEAEKHEAAAKKAQATYQASFSDGIWSHPYVERKEIKPIGARNTRDGRLIIPVRNWKGKTISAQYIDAEGIKRFQYESSARGGYASVNHKDSKPSVETPLVICEGWATACSIFEATGYPVAAALSSKNIIVVAHDLRKKFGIDVPIIIAADDDWMAKQNVGFDDSKKAAVEIGALLAIPEFDPESRKKGDKDFNDMMCARGPEAVAASIKAAKPLHEEKHEHEPQRSTQVFSDADSDRAPGIAFESSIPGGAGDEEADRGDHASPGDVEGYPGLGDDEQIPIEEYARTEGKKEAEWLEPFPGVMEELFKAALRRQNRPQPVLTVAAALAGMSACMHGKYCLPDGLRGNLYIVGLAGSTAGKSGPLNLAKAIVNCAGGISHSNIGSGQGIEDAVSRDDAKRANLVIDEVAHMIGAFADKNAAHYMQHVGKMLLDFYSASESIFTTRLLADETKPPKRIFNPYVTLYGTTTHAKMQNISAGLIEDGTLGRCLVINGDDFVDAVDTLETGSLFHDVETVIGTLAKEVFKFGQTVTFPDEHRLVVPVSTKARQMFIDIRTQFDREARAAESARRTLLGRGLEQVKRVALVLAVWDKRAGISTMVDVQHVEWALTFVRHSQKCLIGFVDKMTDDPVVMLAERIMKVCRDAIKGNEPFGGDDRRFNAVAEFDGIVSRSAIAHKLKVDTERLQKAINHLVATGDVIDERIENRGKGPKFVGALRVVGKR